MRLNTVNMSQEILAMAIELTKLPSISGTAGERECAEAIFTRLGKSGYYQDNPQYLFLSPLPGDPNGRKNVIALLKGKKRASPKTVILLAHFDTVGIDDYADLKDYALNPRKLMDRLANRQLEHRVRDDLLSGEWIFGRGIADMKTSVAVYIWLLEQLSSQVDELSGNVVLLLVPDEEANSAGAIAAVKTLKDLSERENLDYLAVIDNDYMTDEDGNEDLRYIHFGTIGKLMPSFYVAGKETHSTEAFSGLDSNLLMAELTRLIDLNMELADRVGEQITPPPISLKQQDLKKEYSVQTPYAAFAYYNYLTYRLMPVEVLARLKAEAQKAFVNVLDYLNRQYRHFCLLRKTEYLPLPWTPHVLTFEELYAQVKSEIGEEIDRKLAALKREMSRDPAVDSRIYSLRVVEEVYKHLKVKQPSIILYFSPPYYPHIHLEGNTEKEKKLIAAVDHAIGLVQGQCSAKIVKKDFFPGICDLSYFALGGASQMIDKLVKNMPAWGEHYSLPLQEMQNLNLPVVNIGAYGRDAHKWTERLHIPYSTQIMPQLIYHTLEFLLDK